MTVRPLNTMEDLVRDLRQRVAALEQRTTSRGGDWVIHGNDNGDLVATSPSGRTVVLSDEPEQVVIVQQVTTTEEGSTT